MTKMQEIYKKVAADSALQAKFNEIMAAADKDGSDSTMEKLVAFANEAGFEVTPDEIKGFFSTISEKSEGELSDSELDAVAGGKGLAGVLASIFGLGVGCAIYSAVTDGAVNSSCGSHLKYDL